MLTKQGATRLHDATLNWTPNSSSETQPRRHDSGKPPPGAQSQLFSIHGHVGSCWRYRPHPAATFGLSFFRFVLGGDTQEQKIWRKHEDYLSKVFFWGGNEFTSFTPVYSILSEECLDSSRTQHGLAILPNWRLYGSNFSLFNKTGIAANGWKRGHVITCIQVVLYIYIYIYICGGNVNCDLKLTL